MGEITGYALKPKHNINGRRPPWRLRWVNYKLTLFECHEILEEVELIHAQALMGAVKDARAQHWGEKAKNYREHIRRMEGVTDGQT